MKQSNGVEELKRPDAAQIHDVVHAGGAAELERSPAALGWSGLAAGFSMGLSLVGEGLIRAALPDEPWRPLLTSFGYSLGFVVVVLGRQQLFTENTLSAVVPFLEERSRKQFVAVLRLWTVVLATNLAGTAAFAWLAAGTEIFSPEAREAFLHIAEEALRPGFGTQALKGLVAGWIIALMVWLLPALGSARILVVVVLTYFIALGELSHVIAGSAEAAYAVAAGAAGWGDYFGRSIVPAFLGNVVGGVVFVALLNHMQVRGSPERERAGGGEPGSDREGGGQ